MQNTNLEIKLMHIACLILTLITALNIILHEGANLKASLIHLFSVPEASASTVVSRQTRTGGLYEVVNYNWWSSLKEAKLRSQPSCATPAEAYIKGSKCLPPYLSQFYLDHPLYFEASEPF